MDVRECIYSRRSIRKFEERQVEREIIGELVEAGIYAPSACNIQAWKFIAVNHETIKEKFSDLKSGISPVIIKAPVNIFVLYRNDIEIGRGRIYGDWIQSAAAAIQNMLLMAHAKGLGACWVCDLPEKDELQRILAIPENFEVIACVSAGYPERNNENSKEAMLYHYGTEELYKSHARKYGVDSVLSYDRFESVEGDSGSVFIKKKSGLPVFEK